MPIRNSSRHRRTKKPASGSRPFYVAEPLEARVLLTFTVSDTNGGETVVMFFSAAHEHIAVNGVDHIADDADVEVDTLDGNDTILVVSTSRSFEVTDTY